MYFVFRPYISGTYLENSANLEQLANTHQPTAWPVPHACAQPRHAGSGSHGQLSRPNWGSSAWHSRWSVNGENPCFFFGFEADIHGRLQCQVTHLTAQTQDHNTERHKTVHYKLTCLRIGAQLRQKSPGWSAPALLTKVHNGANIYSTSGQVKRRERHN